MAQSGAQRVTMLSKNFSRAVSANHEHERRLGQRHVKLDQRKLRARGAINSDVHSLQADLARINSRTPFLDDYLRQNGPASSSVPPERLPYGSERKRGGKAQSAVRFTTNGLDAQVQAQQEAGIVHDSKAESMTSCPADPKRFPYNMMNPHIEGKIADFLRKISPDEEHSAKHQETTTADQKGKPKSLGGQEPKSKPESRVFSRRAQHPGSSKTPTVQLPRDGATTTDAALIAQSSSYMERLRRVLQRTNLDTQTPAASDPVLEGRLHSFKVIARKIQVVQERRAKTAMDIRKVAPQTPAQTPQSRGALCDQDDDAGFSLGSSDSESEHEDHTSTFKLAF